MPVCPECQQEIPPVPVPEPLDELVDFILYAKAIDRKQEISHGLCEFSPYDAEEVLKWRLAREKKERWLKALREARGKGD